MAVTSFYGKIKIVQKVYFLRRLSNIVHWTLYKCYFVFCSLWWHSLFSLHNWTRVIFLAPRHVVLSTRQHSVFWHIFLRHCCFASRVILFQPRHNKKCPRHKFSALETCFNADSRSQPALTPAGGQIQKEKGSWELACSENFRWSTRTGGNCIQISSFV